MALNQTSETTIKQIHRQISIGRRITAIMLTAMSALPLSAHKADDMNVNDSIAIRTENQATDSIAEQFLNEVVVTAKTPAVRVTPDRTVYDLKSTVMGQSGTLIDALSAIPGVNVGSDGAVTLYGNRGAAIVIDGQKTYLKGVELANYLRSLPATAVSTIGLRTTATAKDDASDKAGVIEITTRRIRERGFTLGLNGGASAWRNARSNGSVNMAYNTGRSEFTLLYSFFAARQHIRLDIDRFFITDTDRMLQQSTRRRSDNANTVKAGWRYKLSSQTWLGANLRYSRNCRNEFGRMDAFIPVLGENDRSDNHNRSRWRNVMADIYLDHRFRSGATLSGDLNHFRYNTSERQLLEPMSPDTLRGAVGGRIRWYIGRIDFSKMFGTSWKLQAGIKSTIVSISNAGTYSNLKAGEWKPNSSLSSTFRYKANTNAAYTQISFTRGHLTATAGARLEHEKLRGRFSGNEAAADTSYRVNTIDVVPTAELKYFADNGAGIMLACSRRIERPNYADLNPFVYIFDEYTHAGGNINLHTSTSDHVQLGFSYGGRWQGAVFLTHSDDAIMKCYHEISDRSVYVASENFPHHMQYGFRLMLANQPIGRRCHTTVTAIGMHNRYDWMDGKVKTSTRRFTPIVSIDSRLDFGAGWTGELKASYTGYIAYGQVTVKPSGYVDAGLRKSFKGGKASLTIFVKDILATNTNKTEIKLKGRSARFDETEYRRIAGVSFHYKFHTGRKSSAIREQKAPEELDRL